MGDFDDGVGVGQESVELVQAGLDFLEAVVTGGDGVLEGASLILEVGLQVLQVLDLGFVGLAELVLTFLQGSDESGDQVQDVVQGLRVDLGAHLDEAFDDWLEEGQ